VVRVATFYELDVNKGPGSVDKLVISEEGGVLMASTVEPLRLASVSKDRGVSGADLQQRREALGLSVSALAKRAGVDRATLDRVEGDAEGVRGVTRKAVERTLVELEAEIGMDDPTPEPESKVVRFVVRGVYGAEALVVEGPVESIAELERSVDRIMRRLRDTPPEA
jgi:transcriptional regulator with XRE-family HTH domain